MVPNSQIFVVGVLREQPQAPDARAAAPAARALWRVPAGEQRSDEGMRKRRWMRAWPVKLDMPFGYRMAEESDSVAGILDRPPPAAPEADAVPVSEPLLAGACLERAAPRSASRSLILTLHEYWSAQGCVILQPYDMEMGAGTFHPATTLRALGPKPWKAAYVQPSRRPTDGRYGENPNRLGHYYQYQVILKPSAGRSPAALSRFSLAAIGIDFTRHDIRFVEDDWESPTLGAWGLGWEVWCDGMEVTQFTYFQQVGGYDCKPVSGELTYGLERLAMYIQNVENVYDLAFNDEGRELWRRFPRERERILRL